MRGLGLLTTMVLTLLPIGLSAQSIESEWESYVQRKQFQYLAVNSLLGGAAAGLAALMRDEPFLPAVGTGAGGGALAFAGKRLSVQGWRGAGLLGRQLNSVGSSITGNVVAGRGGLDRVALSLGPIRLWVGDELRVRVDAPALGAAIWTVAEGARFDLQKSLWSGALVFEGDHNYGLPGTIVYQPVSPGTGPYRVHERVAHEQVHVLQYDQSYLSLGAPVEEWFEQRFERAGLLVRHLEWNLVPLAIAGASGRWLWDYRSRPWESEAFFLGALGSSR